jgi:hypothetical protein
MSIAKRKLQEWGHALRAYVIPRARRHLADAQEALTRLERDTAHQLELANRRGRATHGCWRPMNGSWRTSRAMSAALEKRDGLVLEHPMLAGDG